jgi:hypothetical protein
VCCFFIFCLTLRPSAANLAQRSQQGLAIAFRFGQKNHGAGDRETTGSLAAGANPVRCDPGVLCLLIPSKNPSWAMALGTCSESAAD